jgi:tetratricopeptide (TPR) repeat protein
MNKGYLDRAIADYDQAIKFDPKDASAYYNRALALEGKGDLQRALVDFKTFTELDPSDPDGPAAVARVTKALKGE